MPVNVQVRSVGEAEAGSESGDGNEVDKEERDRLERERRRVEGRPYALHDPENRLCKMMFE